MDKTVLAPVLQAQVASVLVAAGSAAAEADQVAANLVLANLSGHDSHGVGMVPRYVDAVLEGGLKPNASAKLNFDGGALLALDGRRGYGQVVGEQAMTLAMARAKELGSCIMALAHAHHLGRIGHFAEMAVGHGLVAVHFVNVLSRPVVAPWGGSDGRFGTNPFCAGIPLKGKPPFVLDFATSRVAQGKMRVAHNEGRQVEPGYLIDEHGHPTTDPGVVARVKEMAAGKRSVLVVLDSNHTHAHVLAELRLYSPLVRKGGYLLVFDGIIEDMPPDFVRDRPWGPGNNPKTAVWAFLKENDRFQIDREVQDKLLLTVAPDGYLKCVND